MSESYTDTHIYLVNQYDHLVLTGPPKGKFLAPLLKMLQDTIQVLESLILQLMSQKSHVADCASQQN